MSADHDSELAEPFDLGQLDAEERELWVQFFASHADGEAPAIRVWSFGYICMLELGRVPKQ